MSAGAGAMELTGARELQRTLKELGPKIERKVTRQAMSKAANPIIKAARANLKSRLAAKKKALVTELRAGGMKARMAGRVAKRTKFSRTEGNLARSIGKRTKTYTAAGVVFVAIGPKWPQGAHGHLIEYGHKPSGWYARQAGATFIPARPFMRPAWDAHKRGALGIAIREHRGRIENEARKAAIIKRA